MNPLPNITQCYDPLSNWAAMYVYEVIQREYLGDPEEARSSDFIGFYPKAMSN